MKLFIDTNIIIDLLADRKPFSNAAYLIFQHVNTRKWQLYTSSNSIITTYYVLTQHINPTRAIKAIETLLKRIDIEDLDRSDLIKAINSKTIDLEDASQIACAQKIEEVRYLVTRDKKGFKESKIEVIHPDELVALYLS